MAYQTAAPVTALPPPATRATLRREDRSSSRNEEEENAAKGVIIPDSNDDVFKPVNEGKKTKTPAKAGHPPAATITSSPLRKPKQSPKQNTTPDRPRSRPTPPLRSRTHRKRESERKMMAFQDLFAGGQTGPTGTSPTSRTSTPPKAGLTPPHLEAGLVGGERRVQTSSTMQQSSPSMATQTTSFRRTIIPHGPRRQTTNMASRTSYPQQQRTQRSGYYRPSMPAYGLRRQNPLELRVRVDRVPAGCTTWDLYQTFERFGSVSRIDMQRPATLSKTVWVSFKPTPADLSFIGRPLMMRDSDGRSAKLEMSNASHDDKQIRSTTDPSRSLPERLTISLLAVDFGVMKDESEMMVMQSTEATGTTGLQLAMDLYDKALFLSFPITTSNGTREKHFRFRINPAQIKGAHLTKRFDQSVQLTIAVEHPPMIFRKTSDVQATFDSGSTLWDERQTWFRQTNIDENPKSRNKPVQLRNDDCIVDTGRWLTYSLNFKQEVAASQTFQDIKLALLDHNISITEDKIAFDFEHFRQPSNVWRWMHPPNLADTDHANSSLSDLLAVDDGIHLKFKVKYQLEVCLSMNVLHEANMDRDFLRRLAEMEPNRAVKLLEKVAECKERYYNPSDAFSLQDKVTVYEKPRPAHFIKTPSAIITPTTIYFATPVLETSNRVIRKYQQHEDRFLRVKFMDERYKGKLMSRDDRSHDELFTRVMRALTHGIDVGDRHYEFLAFGGSQFREHGAYFFAPTSGLNAAEIRDWMGDFTNIKVVAKYCSRLGQCFTTTRAIPYVPKVETIADVERNGFCFTDGVGKISPLLAKLIAHHYNLHNADHDVPSMFQIRMAGCKGVVAVDPSLEGMTVQIRPSQEKFSAKYYGLEICRISSYATASLNRQLILVLSSLGISDDVFVNKAKKHMKDLNEAMVIPQKALDHLQKKTDFNGVTTELALMVLDGFMDAGEPFLHSCLHLWKVWNLKKLKEQAQIFVDDSAFLLGGTDETQTLRGHFDTSGTLGTGEAHGDDHGHRHKQESNLPEIFLQIPVAPLSTEYKVVTGICLLARNPSLHPGDVRVVRAVDVPALHHMKNVVILPQTGDRDLANMCSGGDLDGDDYLVIWDEDLIPPEWNHDPMDYTSPTPEQAKGPVTVSDIAKFFVKHIKHDNLGRIAVAHRYWADAPDVSMGVKDQRCLELAELHSRAVDYAKTGVEAIMPRHLAVQRWPHWSEPKDKARSKIYTSRKVLGKVYDSVETHSFAPCWEMPFDERILNACEPDEQMLKDAKEVKVLYDESVRRIMAQYGINTEFEVWTTFAREHHQDLNDYKFAEKFGEVRNNLVSEHREMCFAKAGSTPQQKDDEKMKQFLVAMYTVTANEVREAVEKSKETEMRGGREVQVNPMTLETMPFMSFPWIFARELGQIATKGKPRMMNVTAPKAKGLGKSDLAKKNTMDLVGDWTPAPLPEINLDGEEGGVQEGRVLGLFHHEDGGKTSPPQVETSPGPILGEEVGNTPVKTPPVSILDEDVQEPEVIDVERLKAKYQASGLPVDSPSPEPQPELVKQRVDSKMSLVDVSGSTAVDENTTPFTSTGDEADDEKSEEDEGEEVQIDFQESALDKLNGMFG